MYEVSKLLEACRGIVAFNKITTVATKAVRFISEYPDLTLISLHKVSAIIVLNVSLMGARLKATEVPFQDCKKKQQKPKLQKVKLLVVSRQGSPPASHCKQCSQSKYLLTSSDGE